MVTLGKIRLFHSCPISCGVIQGPGGQPGGVGQRGPNVRAVFLELLLLLLLDAR